MTESENSHIYGLIMAGGKGSRLGLLEGPKQTQALNSDLSLIQETYNRTVKSEIPVNQIYISTTTNLEDKIKSQLPEIDQNNFIAEPEQRNTLAAIGYNCLYLSLVDSEAIIASIPSDHVVQDPEVFNQSFNKAIKAVEQNPDQVVFLGVKPTQADTGLGYIKMGQVQNRDNSQITYKIDSFCEKPDQKTANKYYHQSKYLWNTANYFFKAENMLQLVKQYQPETYQILMEIKDLLTQNNSGNQAKIRDLYSTIPSTQIADAIFSKKDFKSALVIPSKIHWKDLGTWKSIYDHFLKDKSGVKESTKNIKVRDHHCLILNNTNETIATLGLKDSLIVHTLKGTLVVKKNSLDQVDSYVKKFDSLPSITEDNNVGCEINNETDTPILVMGQKDILIEKSSEGLVVASFSEINKLRKKSNKLKTKLYF